MRKTLSGVIAHCRGGGGALVHATPLAGQTAAYRAPRTADGKPDLNGIWQALNEANYDLEMHMAQPAMALRAGPYGPVPAAPVLALGAVGAVPPGMGVVEGDEIPYKPETLAKKKENQDKWLERDPEIKCYLPGVPRANYMPQPFQILQSQSAIFFAYQYAGAVRNVYLKDPGPAPIDSWMGQSVGVGRRHAGHRRHRLQRHDMVRSRGQFPQRQAERGRAVHPHVRRRAHLRGDDRGPDVFTRPWKISMPLYRRAEKNAQLMDFKCVEFVEELMYGQWRKRPLSR